MYAAVRMTVGLSPWFLQHKHRHHPPRLEEQQNESWTRISISSLNHRHLQCFSLREVVKNSITYSHIPYRVEPTKVNNVLVSAIRAYILFLGPTLGKTTMSAVCAFAIETLSPLRIDKVLYDPTGYVCVGGCTEGWKRIIDPGFSAVPSRGVPC